MSYVHNNYLLVKQLAKMMLQQEYTRLMLLWFVVHCMVSGVISSHFRGSIFMIRPKPGGTQGEVRQ